MVYQWLGLYSSVKLTGEESNEEQWFCKFSFPCSIHIPISIFCQFQLPHYYYACMANLFLLGWYIVQLQLNPMQVHVVFFLWWYTCVFHMLYYYNESCNIWQLPLSYIFMKAWCGHFPTACILSLSVYFIFCTTTIKIAAFMYNHIYLYEVVMPPFPNGIYFSCFTGCSTCHFYSFSVFL